MTLLPPTTHHRAAKRKKIIKYEGELLLQGVHDNVDIVLLRET